MKDKKSCILIRLPENERFALRLELLKKRESMQGFLRRVIQREIGEDTETTKQVRA